MDALTIVGAGGIGCAVGYFLRAAGVRVTFVDADAAKIAWGRATACRSITARRCRPSFVPFADWRPEPGARSCSAPSATTTTPCWPACPIRSRSSRSRTVSTAVSTAAAERSKASLRSFPNACRARLTRASRATASCTWAAAPGVPGRRRRAAVASWRSLLRRSRAVPGRGGAGHPAV